MSDNSYRHLFEYRCFDPPEQHRDRSFDGATPMTELLPNAGPLADAVCDMLYARALLERARAAVPNYTAQWSDEDYYRDELSTYNAACNKLLQVVKTVNET